MSSQSQYLQTIDAFLSPIDFPGSFRTMINFDFLYGVHLVVAALPLIVLELTNNLVVGSAYQTAMILPVIVVMFGFPIFAFVRRGLLRERMEEQRRG